MLCRAHDAITFAEVNEALEITSRHKCLRIGRSWIIDTVRAPKYIRRMRHTIVGGCRCRPHMQALRVSMFWREPWEFPIDDNRTSSERGNRQGPWPYRKQLVFQKQLQGVHPHTAVSLFVGSGLTSEHHVV